MIEFYCQEQGYLDLMKSHENQNAKRGNDLGHQLSIYNLCHRLKICKIMSGSKRGESVKMCEDEESDWSRRKAQRMVRWRERLRGER